MCKHKHDHRCDRDDNRDDRGGTMYIAFPLSSMTGTVPMQGRCTMTPRGPVCHIMPAGVMAMGDMGDNDDMDMPCGGMMS